MKDLIRKCYQEAGITNANAKLFENRVTAIQHILDDKDFFEKEDWTVLTKYAIGAVSSGIVESQLIDLEEAFCETDDGYTNENIKELHILVELLLYQYCLKTEDLLLASIVICGYGIGWKLKSSLLYEKFLSFAMTSPMYSSGTITHTFIIGSSSVGSAFWQASLKAMEPAILNAISEESTSW